MKFKEIIKQKWASYSIATCSAVLLYMALSHIGIFFGWIGSLWSIFSPVVIGCIFSYLMNPVSNYFEKNIFKKVKKEESRHACSVILSVGFVLVLLTLLILMVVPAITGSITGIINNYNTYYKNVEKLIKNLTNTNQLQILSGLNIELPQISEYLDQFTGTVFGGLKNTLTSVMSKIGDIGSSLFNIIIGFIIAVYFLMAKKNLRRAFDRLRNALISKTKIESENKFWSKCHAIFIQYIGCSLLDACIIGIANALFMAIFGMQNITLISLIVGMTNLLPTFGPLIGGAIGIVLLLLTNPVHALYFLIFTVILQAMDGYVIKPKLFSNSLGLSPVLTLVSIILGGKMFGILGILLAIPVIAVVDMLYGEKFLPWLQKIRQEKEKSESETFPEASQETKASENTEEKQTVAL